MSHNSGGKVEVLGEYSITTLGEDKLPDEVKGETIEEFKLLRNKI